MSCVEQINVIHPDYLKLTKVEIDRTLVVHVTNLRLKLIEIDLEEHREPGGGNFFSLFIFKEI